MQIAVIGTGNVGSALGGAFARAGHEVTFASRNLETAETVAAETGSTAAGIAEAVAAAEVVVLAVPFTSAAEVAVGIADVAVGRIVIDATNPLKPDYSGLSTEGGPSGAEQLAALLPGATVVKAFNTLFAGIQGRPDALGTPLDALFATDDDAAAATVAGLASAIGFRPVKVGPLAAARELEALAWLNIRLQLLSSGSWQTSYVLVAPPAAALAA